MSGLVSFMFRLFVIFLILIYSPVFSYDYLLYIFNKPIDSKLFTVKDGKIWVDEKVIEFIKKRVELKVSQDYFDKTKSMYLLNALIYDNKDKLILMINKDTKIIDVNTFYNPSNIKESNKFDNLPTNNLPNLKNSNETYSRLETKYFVLYYTNNQLGLILSNLLDVYYDNILSFLRISKSKLLDIGYKVPIYLAPNDDVYKSFNFVPDWSSGALVFDFSSKIPSFVIYAHERDQVLIQRVLPHEITHLILSLYLRENVNDRRTTFIQEGLAQYNEYRLLTGLDNIVIHPKNKINFENLLYPSFSSDQDIRNFYENSLSFTSFLMCRYGRDNYIKFLEKTKLSLDIVKNLNDVYQFQVFYNEKEVIQKIDYVWEDFIRNTKPTPLR